MSDNITMPRDDQRPIRFTRHAIEEAQADGLSLARVKEIIRGGSWQPNEAGRFGQSGWSAQGSLDGRTIRAIFVETEDRRAIEILLVVTVWRIK